MLPSKPILKFDLISKYVKDHPILENISFEIKKGEVLGLIGPSGAGKSTLLRCINHLEEWDSGRIELLQFAFDPETRLQSPTLYQKQIQEIRKKVGMVFQQFNLWPHMTVLGNLTYAPIHVLKMPVQEASLQAEILLDRVGLKPKISAYPANLSGGQQQRVAIVRAMMMQPEMLLFDEPTSALDPQMSLEVLSLIRELSETGITLLIASHELRFIRDISDRILFLRNGLLCHDLATEQAFSHPPSKELKEFLNP